jgi:hypothetical protein
MKHPVILIALILTAASLRADDITTIRGEKFTNVTISRVEPDGIIVIKSDGIVKIPFSDLSPELRAKYGYDPEKAAQYKTAVQAADNQRVAEAGAAEAANAAATTQAAAAKAQQDALAKTKKYRIQGSVFQKTAEGLVLERLGSSNWEAELFEKHRRADRVAGIAYAEPAGSFLFLRGHPDEAKLADHDVVDVVGYDTGIYSNGGTTYHAYTFSSK